MSVFDRARQFDMRPWEVAKVPVAWFDMADVYDQAVSEAREELKRRNGGVA